MSGTPKSTRSLPAATTSTSSTTNTGIRRLCAIRLLLRQEYKPIVAVVSRLDRQKGVGLMRHAIFLLPGQRLSVCPLGSSPDPAINHEFWQIKHQLNDNPDCHLELSYNEELAHLIYARRRYDPHPQRLRAMRADSDDRHEVRDRAGGAQHRRAGRHRI